jgi:BA14K-like protein
MLITINAIRTFIKKKYLAGCTKMEIALMFGPRVVQFVTPFCVAVILSLALPAAESFAQASNPDQTKRAPKVNVTPRTVRTVTPRAGRVETPRVVRRATPGAGRAVTRQKAIVTRRTSRVVTQRKTVVTPRAKRIVTPGIVSGVPKAVAPRIARQPMRKAPANLALVNKGTPRNPGRYKPANVQHNPAHKAGRTGWIHRHQAFFFKRGQHRWRRHYYSFLAGGLWYWYWYDVSVDSDPDALVYSVLPECDPDSDDCTESDAIIAPAILEDRASEEAMAQCAAEFRSFDARTGTYVVYGGEVRVCPYLE